MNRPYSEVWIRFGEFGDLAMLCALSHALAAKVEALDCTLVTAPAFTTFARRYGAFSFVIEHPGRAESQIYEQLLAASPDAIIDLHHRAYEDDHYFTWLRSWRGVPVAVVSSRARHYPDDVPLRIVADNALSLHRHHADYLSDRLGASLAPLTRGSLRLYPTPADRERASEVTRALRRDNSRHLVAFVPFSRRRHKEWLNLRWQELAVLLQREDNDLCALCSDAERGRAETLFNGCDLPIVTAATPEDFVALVLGVDVLVAVDSGIKHLAGYLSKPVVALYGPTSEHIWGSLGLHERPLSSTVECRPCHDAFGCPRPAWICMEGINAAAVAEMVANVRASR